MSIYITGDCHGNFRKLNTECFPEQKEMTKNDTVIIAGDFGGYWNDSKESQYWRKWLSEKTFQTVFVDGNHENFDLLNAAPEETWNGGRVHRIPGSDILHLMRGQMFEIDGCKIFTFGGARSHDIFHGIIPYTDHWRKTAKEWEKEGKWAFRVEHISWWKEELPSAEEMDDGVDMLAKHDWKCHYIVTHDCPASDLALLYGAAGEQNELTQYLEKIRQKTDYKKWFFGHHHEDRAVNDKEIMLYDQIVRIW